MKFLINSTHADFEQPWQLCKKHPAMTCVVMRVTLQATHPTFLWLSLCCWIKQADLQYLVPIIFIQSPPPHSLPVLLHRLLLSDCDDWRWFSFTALEAAGIRRRLWVSGLLITCAAASLLLYPAMFWLSEQWDLTCNLWLVVCLDIWKWQLYLSMRQKLQCFSARLLWLHLHVNSYYFEYWTSSPCVYFFIWFRECKSTWAAVCEVQTQTNLSPKNIPEKLLLSKVHFITLAFMTIRYLKVTSGLCDHTNPTTEVVLDLKDAEKKKGFQWFKAQTEHE